MISHAPEGKSPGPNLFLNDPKTIRLDGRGRLRLSVDQVDGTWACSEVRLKEALGYGTYEVVLLGFPGRIDPNVVFGFFTFDHDAPPLYREIDIEIARWSDPTHPGLGYSVQPSEEPRNQALFSADELGRTVVFRFVWDERGVKSVAFNRTDTGDLALGSWSWSGNITPGNAQLHLNLWLFRGQSPTDDQRQWGTIESFSFDPAP